MATSQCLPALSLERLVNPTEKQREFLRAIAEHDYVLYGGAAGGGKSYILRWWLALYLVWVYRVLGLRNVTVGLFCEDYPTLNDRQISKIKFEFPSALGTLRDRNFVLRPEYGRGILALRNLDDPSKYQSAEFAAIGVDELTKNSKEVFDFLRFRLRWPGIERPKFAGATNPGGPGHAWVKKLWKTADFPEELKPAADQFKMVQAKASDNPYLTTDYYRKLRTLPPDMAKKFAEGDWDIYEGKFFTQWDEKRYVRPHAEILKLLNPWHTRWLSGDWGYFHPHTIHKHARTERDLIITYGELWDHRVGEDELGRRIGKMCLPEIEAKIPIHSFPFSWDAFGKISPRSQAKIPKSITDLIKQALPKWIPEPCPADSSVGSRVNGARLMAQLLDSDRWIISDACPRLTQCIPNLIRNEDNLEDVLKVDYTENEIGDDPYDSARMGLQHMLRVGKKPFQVRVQDAIDEYAEKQGKTAEELDPNTQAWINRQATAAEHRRNRRRGGLGRIWRPPTPGGM